MGSLTQWTGSIDEGRGKTKETWKKSEPMLEIWHVLTV